MAGETLTDEDSIPDEDPVPEEEDGEEVLTTGENVSRLNGMRRLARAGAEDSLLAYYSLSNLEAAAADTEITDESGNGNSAYIRGNGAQVRIGSISLPGGANGSNAAYVELPKGMFDKKDKVTISVWLQNETGSGDYAAMYFGQTKKEGNNFPTLYWILNPSKDGCFKSVMTKSVNASTPYSTETSVSTTRTTDSWQMYTTVIEDNKITGYLDGKKVSEDSGSTLKVTDFGNDLVSYIGRSEYPDKFYSGGVKNVRIYEDALTMDEVQALYQEEKGSDEKKTSSVKATGVIADIEDITVVEGTEHEIPAYTNASVSFSDGSKKDNARIIWKDSATGRQITNTKDLDPGVYNLTGKLSYFGNPLIEERADPYITYDEAEGYYYFTSSWPAYGNVNNGYDRISLRCSKTLEGLADAPENVIWNAHASGGQSKHIWAPEMHKINGKWYIYYAANSDDTIWSIRCYALECKEGADPLKADSWTEKGRITKKDGTYTGCFDAFSLDMTYFENNGKAYVIWAYKSGSSVLKMAEINSSEPWKLAGDPITLSVPEYSWERVNEKVNEGPAVLKKDGKIYVTYSASATGDEYCMGMLTADAGSDLMKLGSWTKSPLPVLETSDFSDQYGPGHNSFTVDENKNIILVYHSRDQECHENKCAYANSDPLYDPCRNANLAYVRFADDGTPVFLNTEEKECAEIGVDSYKMTVTVTEKEEANLIASYPLIKDGNDTSGHGYNGTLYGNNISFDHGLLMQGASGKTGENYLDLSGNAGLLDAIEGKNNLTITAWVRNDTTGNTKNTVFSFGKDDKNFFAFNTLNWGNPRGAFVVSDNESGFKYDTAGTKNSITGEWYPVTIVLKETESGTQIRYYMNDELALDVASSYRISDLGELTFFRIGGGVNTNYYDMVGSIRNVSVYDRALGIDRIREYNTPNYLAFTEELLNIPNAEDVRGNITLPSEGMFGTAISWKSSNPSVISDRDNGRYKAGVVRRQKTDTDVTLTAAITLGGQSITKEFRVKVKAAAEEKHYEDYLFAYFTGEGSANGEQIYFAGSKDGLNWRALNEGNPVLSSNMGDKGLRDPFIIRSPEGDKFYLIATDLKIYQNTSWGDSQTKGSKCIMVWESVDLVNWSDQRMVKVAADNAGCTWAPEAFYDDETGEYIVFWASKTSDDNFGVHQIYYATTRDFYTFSEPKIWITLRNKNGDKISVIDTSVIAVTDDNGEKTYYRISKNEASSNAAMEEGEPESGKYTYLETSDSLTGTWTRIPSSYLTKTQYVEGGTFFQFNNEDKWCLLLDDFGGGGYFPSITADIGTGEFERLDKADYVFPSTMRHGTVIGVTKEEYRALQKKWGIEEADMEPDVPIEDSVIAHFSFDDAENGLKGNGAAAQHSGTPTFSADAVSGNAISLTSSKSEWLNVTKDGGGSLLTGYDTLTVNYWSKSTATGKGWSFYAAPNANAPSYPNEHYFAAIDLSSGIEVQRYNNSGSRPPSAKTSEVSSGWKMVTVVVEPKITKIYIDGELKASEASSYGLIDILQKSSVFQIGKANWGSGEYFNGLIDEMTVYGRALSAGEVGYLAGRRDIPVESIQVQAEKEKVYVGESTKVTAKVYPLVASDSSVTWTVSDETKAELKEDGTFIGKEAGKVTVTATAADGSGVSGSKAITIMNVPVSSIKVSADKTEIKVGETLQMNAEVIPENAAVKTVAWSVEPSDMAEIDVNGILTGKNAGSVTVTASATDNSGIKGELAVTIVEKGGTEEPDHPENPDNPENPDQPENPGQPDNPDKPDQPEPPVNVYKIPLVDEYLTLTNDSYVYTGSQIIPKYTVKYNKKKLKENVDYIVKYTNNVYAGTASIKITGMGDFTSSVTKNFAITPKDIRKAVIQEIGDYVYTGSKVVPSILVMDGERILEEGRDISIEYSSDLVGSPLEDTVVTVKVSGTGNYTGEVAKAKTFKILCNPDITNLSDQSKVSVVFKDSKGDTPKKTYTYNGKLQKPAVLVTDVSTGKALKSSQYKVIYGACVNAGTAVVNVIGKGEYAGTQTLTFTIGKKELSKVKISKIPNITYDGDALKELSLTVKDGKKYLREGEDYTVVYNNLNALSSKNAKASAVLRAIETGNYTGASKEMKFSIVQRKLNNKNAVRVVVADASVNPDGSAVEPEVTVTYNGEVLEEGTDYTLKFSGNKKVTTKAKVTVKAVKGGLYKGKVTQKFEITG